MLALLVFAAALFLAALISELAHRSIVSAAVRFLVVGFVDVPAWRERFASIVYGVFILRAHVGDRDALFRLIAVVVGLSIVAPASTDVVVAPGSSRPLAPTRTGGAPASGSFATPSAGLLAPRQRTLLRA